MARIYRIPTSQVDGNSSNDNTSLEIRPRGEIGLYVGDNDKLELLIFDGVRTHVNSKVLRKGTFYGGDSDSSDVDGDGIPFDTIKLIPDEALRQSGSEQYLVIEPTTGEPGHIHIRAGGTIDQSTADLFIGGEQQNLRVSDTNDRVTITTDLQYTWTFDGSGNLTIPGNIGSESAINIDINLTDSSLRRWQFGEDGSFSLPGNLTISPIGNYAPINGTVMLQAPSEQLALLTSGVGGGVQLGWTENAFAMGNIAAASFNEGDSGEVKIATGGFGIGLTAYNWTFGNDGDLTIPGSIGSESAINIDVNLTDSTLRRWTFGQDGGLTFPDATTQTTAWSGGRIVNPPNSSKGAEGDLVGDLAFDDSYIYRCTANYAIISYNTALTRETNNSNVFYVLDFDEFQDPTGGTLQFNPDSGGQTVNVISAEIDETEWALTLDITDSFGLGTPVKITLADSDIWRRIQWSGNPW